MNEPVLRPATAEGELPAPCPRGYETEPAGIWHGKAMEVVYDPRRHDVAFFRGGVSPKVRDGLVDTGWQHQVSDGASEMWTRHRSDLARQRLQRVPSAPKLSRVA